MSERYVCTKDAPWSKDKGEFAQHPDAVNDGEDHDTYERYDCPHCGLSFKVELPDY